MIGDFFTLVERGEGCALTRMARDWEPGELTMPGMSGCFPLLGEIRFHRDGGGCDYQVLDLVDDTMIARSSADTCLELWDRRHAALVRAQADVRRAREALKDVGLIVPYLTLRREGVAMPGREPVPTASRMVRLHQHWKGIPRAPIKRRSKS